MSKKTTARAATGVVSTVVMGVALATISVASYAQPAATPGGETAIRFPPVVVTAPTVAGTLARPVSSTHVLSRADIQQASSTRLADVFAQANGVSVRRRGAPGVQADVSIRGGDFSQTLVMVNGIPIRNPHSSHLNFELPVALNDVARVVVTNGPGAVQFGGSATSGVVNVITRHPQGQTGAVRVRAGSHASAGINVFYGNGDAHNSMIISARGERTDGESSARPTDADSRQLFYAGRHQSARYSLNWGLAAAKKSFGAWGFYSGTFPDARERTRTRMAWLGAGTKLSDWTLNSRLYWHGQHDWFLTRVGAANFINRHNTDSMGVQARMHRSSGHGTTAFGTNLRRESIHSNALGIHDRSKAAVWLYRRQHLGDAWQLQLGLNHVNYGAADDDWLPSALLQWQITSHWRTHIAAARGARVPDYTELALNTAANQGNAGLKPEIATSYEWGVDGSWAAYDIKATVFERHVNDLIDWSKSRADVTWHAGNFNGYRARGASAQWRWHPDVPWLNSLGVSFSALHTEVKRPPLQQIKYALHIPRQTWKAFARIATTDNTLLSITARRPNYQNQIAVTLANVRYTWTGDVFDVAFEVSNVFDKKIIETGFAPIAGRWFYVSLGVHI